MFNNKYSHFSRLINQSMETFIEGPIEGYFELDLAEVYGSLDHHWPYSESESAAATPGVQSLCAGTLCAPSVISERCCLPYHAARLSSVSQSVA